MSVTTVALDTRDCDYVIISGAIIKSNQVSFIGRVNTVIRGAATDRAGLMNKVNMSHCDIKKRFIG